MHIFVAVADAGTEGEVNATSCCFCGVDPERILLENEHAIAITDAFPISEGHALVVPRRHVRSVFDLDLDEQLTIWKLVGEVRGLLLDRFQPTGFNVGINDGHTAGQTVEHAHVHVIPRRQGDVLDPRGGVRNVIPDRARYWERT